MTARHILGVLAAALMLAAPARAQEAVVEMHLITPQGVGQSIGTIQATDTADGLLLKLDLAAELPPGAHGFHVHESPSCEPGMKESEPVAGLAAGGHYDPEGTGRHMGPGGAGHLGDLPVVYVEVDEDGALALRRPVVAPRLELSDIRGRALVIHAQGDNYRDEPEPLGGSGARIACGVVPE